MGISGRSGSATWVEERYECGRAALANALGVRVGTAEEWRDEADRLANQAQKLLYTQTEGETEMLDIMDGVGNSDGWWDGQVVEQMAGKLGVRMAQLRQRAIGEPRDPAVDRMTGDLAGVKSVVALRSEHFIALRRVGEDWVLMNSLDTGKPEVLGTDRRTAEWLVDDVWGENRVPGAPASVYAARGTPSETEPPEGARCWVRWTPTMRYRLLDKLRDGEVQEVLRKLGVLNGGELVLPQSLPGGVLAQLGADQAGQRRTSSRLRGEQGLARSLPESAPAPLQEEAAERRRTLLAVLTDLQRRVERVALEALDEDGGSEGMAVSEGGDTEAGSESEMVGRAGELAGTDYAVSAARAAGEGTEAAAMGEVEADTMAEAGCATAGEAEEAAAGGAGREGRSAAGDGPSAGLTARGVPGEAAGPGVALAAGGGGHGALGQCDRESLERGGKRRRQRAEASSGDEDQGCEGETTDMSGGEWVGGESDEDWTGAEAGGTVGPGAGGGETFLAEVARGGNARSGRAGGKAKRKRKGRRRNGAKQSRGTRSATGEQKRREHKRARQAAKAEAGPSGGRGAGGNDGGAGGRGPAGAAGEAEGRDGGGPRASGELIQWKREVATAVTAARTADECVLVQLVRIGARQARPAVVRCHRRDGQWVGTLLVRTAQGGQGVTRLDLQTREAVRWLQGATLRVGLLGGARSDDAAGAHAGVWRAALERLRGAARVKGAVQLQLLDAGRLHRLQVRVRQGGREQQWHNLGDWEIQRAKGGGWEAAPLGAVEECIQRGATVAPQQAGWTEQEDSAYWPADARACMWERQSGCHRLLEEALRRHGSQAARRIREVEKAVRQWAAKNGGGTVDACGGASWGGDATGLGVAVGAMSSQIMDVHGSAGGGLGWLVGCTELEVKQVNVDQARVRERAMDARQGEGEGDWRGALYIAGGERPGPGAQAVYTIRSAQRLPGPQRGLVRVELGAGWVTPGANGRAGRWLTGGAAVVVRAEVVQNLRIGRQAQAAAIAGSGRLCRAAGVDAAAGVIMATGVRLDPSSLVLSAEYPNTWVTARAVATQLSALAGAIGQDVASSARRLEMGHRLIDAMRLARNGLELVHGHGLTVGRVEVGVSDGRGGGSGGLVLGGLAGAEWVELLAPKVAVRRDEYFDTGAGAVIQRERLDFTRTCRSLLSRARASHQRIRGGAGSVVEEAAAAAESAAARGAAALFAAIDEFDVDASSAQLRVLEPAFAESAREALQAVRYVRGLEGCCVDALVAEVIGATPETEWAAAVDAMRGRARRARTGLQDLPEHGPMPAAQVQEYVEYFGLRLVVVREARPGGDAHDERELHLWWTAGTREGREGGGASVLAVATGGPGAHGHIELLAEGELRDMLRREVRAGVGRRGNEWERQGRERRRTRQGRSAYGIRARTWRERGADEESWSAGLRRGRVTVVARR